MNNRTKLTRAAAATEGRVMPAMLELRDVEAGRKYLEGRAVPYGVPADIGWYVETFDRGVFAKSIREAANGLPLLLFHNGSSLDTLIGRAESWSEQTDGLHGVWKLQDTDEAKRAADLAADGVLGYMSVGFQPIRSTTRFEDDDDKVYVDRHEARLLEVSLTPTPAYAAAAVTKVRTREASLAPEVAGRRIEGWREYLDTLKAPTR